MAVRLAEIFVEVSAKTARLQKGLQTASASMQRFGKRVEGISTTTKASFAAIGVAGIAGLGLVAQAAGVQEAAVAKLTQSLKNAGDATTEAVEEQLAYASALQATTTFGDEVIIENQALLASFGLTGQALKDATKAALDLSVAQGIDLKASVQLVGKAFLGETGSLSRYGIIIDQNIPKTEKFEAVLAVLNTRFGGAAEADRQTFIGQTKALKGLIGDLAEQIGEALIPILTRLSVGLQGIITRFFALSPATRKTVSIIAALALGLAALGAPIAALLVAIPTLISGAAALGAGFIAVKGAALAASSGLLTFVTTLGALTGPFIVITAAVAGLAIAYVKLSAAVSEQEEANERLAESQKTVSDRQKEGFAVAQEFKGVTTAQARAMEDQESVAKRLTAGIRGLATAQAQAQDPEAKARIGERIEALKALRAEVEKGIETQKKATVVELTEAQKKKVAKDRELAESRARSEAERRLFKATQVEKRLLLAQQLQAAKVRKDRASQEDVSRQLIELENTRIQDEEFQAILRGKTDTELLEIARKQEAQTVSRQFDFDEQLVFDQMNLGRETTNKTALQELETKAAEFLTVLQNTNLNARQKREQIFASVKKKLTDELTAKVKAGFKQEIAARRGASKAGVAAQKPQIAAGFFSAFSSVPFVGQALAIAATKLAFSFISGLGGLQGGGVVAGPPGTDNQLFRLSRGEAVIRKDVSSRLLDFLDAFSGVQQMAPAMAGSVSLTNQVSVVIQEPTVDSDARLEDLAERVGDVIIETLQVNRRGLVP